MKHFKKSFSLVLLAVLLTGCGKEKEETIVEEQSPSYSVIQLDTFEGLKIPVYEQDFSFGLYNPCMLDTENDPAFFNLINKDVSTGIASDYGYNNSDTYNTPYLFAEEVGPRQEFDYEYMSIADMDYSQGIYSNTGRQLELYKSGEYLYEATSPVTIRNDGTVPSIANTTDLEKFAEIIDSVEFIHAADISIESNIKDISNSEMFIKYVTASIEAGDGLMYHGIVAAIEYDDKQYFYIYADKSESPAYESLVNSFEKNPDYNIYKLIEECNKYYEGETVTFDVSGTAGTLDIPPYLRNEDVDGNIYSEALCYIPEDQRDPEVKLTNTANEYGSTELYLANEYYNMTLTYNNFVIPDDCKSSYEMLVRLYGINHGYGTENERYEYGNAANNPNIEQHKKITDRDGNEWDSGFIQANYKSAYGYPMILPYYRTALLYVHKLENSYQIFTFSCGRNKWWTDKDLIKSLDETIASYTSIESATEIPPDALTYYRMGAGYDINKEGYIEKEEKKGLFPASPGDAILNIDDSGDVDEGPEHKDYIENRENGNTTNDGASQNLIDSLPFLEDE